MDILDALILMKSTNKNLNSGGCGVAALSAIRWAEKNNIQKPIGIVFLYDEFEAEEAEKNMSLIQNGHVKSAYTPSHIAILVDNEIIDSDGDGVLSKYYTMHSGITPEELLVLINNGNWNDWFVRKTSIPVIEKQLDIDLSDVLL
jgi:hypothetical protein